MKFSAINVRRLRRPGKYGDGNGLILHVVTPERRNWTFRYERAGRERVMGLGRASDVPLAEAREKAAAARKLLAQGIDPIDARRSEQSEARAKVAARTTFSEAAALYIATHEAGWRNPKHRLQWRRTLATYAEPLLGALPVAGIDVDLVLKALQPIWNQKPETASRVRSRIETVLDYATARGWRTGPNPAIWRGNLKLMLPAKTKLRMVQHHAALPWREAPNFMAELRRLPMESTSVAALKFLVLTATRSGEARGARWDEIDMVHGIWTIPASRMKGAREHRVPLSPPALAILGERARLRDDSGLVFPGWRHRRPMTDFTLTRVLRRIGQEIPAWADLTAHGFRSTFRDWCADNGKPADVAEAALAHAIANKTVAAYARSDLFDPRRRLMDEWATFLDRAPAAVMQMLERRAATGD